MVQEVPFKDYSVEVRDREYIFKIEDFRSNFKVLQNYFDTVVEMVPFLYLDTMKAVTPVIHLVPVALKDEFTEVFLEAAIKWAEDRQLLDKDKHTIRFIYKQLVIYATSNC